MGQIISSRAPFVAGVVLDGGGMVMIKLDELRYGDLVQCIRDKLPEVSSNPHVLSYKLSSNDGKLDGHYYVVDDVSLEPARVPEVLHREQLQVHPRARDRVPPGIIMPEGAADPIKFISAARLS